MEEIVIDQPTSEASAEASALLAIESQAVLKAHGWEMAFWSCSDEDRAEKALHALGKGRDGWELVWPGKVRAEPKSPTEDAEAMARFGPWVYIVGSHFGTKAGPLEPARHFIARERAGSDGARRRGAALHPRYPQEGPEEGEEVGVAHPQERLAGGCRGRRFPHQRRPTARPALSRDPWRASNPGGGRGHRKALPEPGGRSVRPPALGAGGGRDTAREPRGIRAVEEDGSSFLAVTGSLDSTPEESAILQDYPEGERADSLPAPLHPA